MIYVIRWREPCHNYLCIVNVSLLGIFLEVFGVFMAINRDSSFSRFQRVCFFQYLTQQIDVCYSEKQRKTYTHTNTKLSVFFCCSSALSIYFPFVFFSLCVV